MERINKELYESPDVKVVELKMESSLLTLSAPDYEDGGDPFLGL